MTLTNFNLRDILGNKWWLAGLAALSGLAFNTCISTAINLMWIQDNRVAIQQLLANQPLVQRDISDLSGKLSDTIMAVKELTLEMQKRRAQEEIKGVRSGRKGK